MTSLRTSFGGAAWGALGPSGPGSAGSSAAVWPRPLLRGRAHRPRSWGKACLPHGHVPAPPASLECTLRAGARVTSTAGTAAAAADGAGSLSFLCSSAGRRQTQPWGPSGPHPSPATAPDDGLTITFLYSANGPITKVPARIFAIDRPTARTLNGVLAFAPPLSAAFLAIRFGSRRCFNIRCINAHRVAPGACWGG